MNTHMVGILVLSETCEEPGGWLAVRPCSEAAMGMMLSYYDLSNLSGEEAW